MVNFYGKDLIGIDDFTEKTGISLKNYLKLTLRNNEPEINLNKDNDIKGFRKHLYLDINQARTRELMTDLCRVYTKEKK